MRSHSGWHSKHSPPWANSRVSLRGQGRVTGSPRHPSPHHCPPRGPHQRPSRHRLAPIPASFPPWCPPSTQDWLPSHPPHGPSHPSADPAAHPGINPAPRARAGADLPLVPTPGSYPDALHGANPTSVSPCQGRPPHPQTPSPLGEAARRHADAAAAVVTAGQALSGAGTPAALGGAQRVTHLPLLLCREGRGLSVASPGSPALGPRGPQPRPNSRHLLRGLLLRMSRSARRRLRAVHWTVWR